MITIKIQCTMCGVSASILNTNGDLVAFEAWTKELVKKWCITNLFAYRATDFNVAAKALDPIGFGNDRWLLKIAADASLIVCAWSRHGGFNSRAAAVKRLLYKFDLHYLRITIGQPWHPLYLPDNTWPTRWPRKDR